MVWGDKVMTRRAGQEGRVEYTDRAFSQDAQQAMRGEIVRGLIELITNSDDAYVDVELSRGHPGRILVQVEHRKNQPWRVIVRDRATGIKDLVGRITKLGGRSSGFEEGRQKRGNLGRGAKDLAAFGPVTFRTVHDGQFSELVLRPDGSWKELVPPRKAIEADRSLVGAIRGSGTMVEIVVDPQFRCPRHDTLNTALSTHFALRDIMSDPLRKVLLSNLNTEQEDQLCYEYPDQDVVVDQDVELPEYGSSAQLRIWRLPERCDEGPWDNSRPSGILIKGERAIYENTLFDLENNMHSGWFGGELQCALIDELARDFDDRLQQGWAPDTMNPVNPVLRGRDGLERNHPVYASIRAAVQPHLARLVAMEAERAEAEEDRSVSRETRRALDAVARELGRMINEEMKDIEAEELAGLPDQGEPPDIQVVPEEAYAYQGEDRTLTVAVRRDRASVGDPVSVSMSPEGVLELLTAGPTLGEHRRREDVLVTQVRLRPVLVGEMTMVTVCHEGACGEAIVMVRPQREVEPEVDFTPEALEFERERYRIGWKKTRALALHAQGQVVDEQGSRVTVTSSDDGVVVRTPSLDLEYDEVKGHFVGEVDVEARSLGAKAEIVAKCGDASATTNVLVSRKEEAPGLRVKFDDEPSGYWRGLIETTDGVTTIRVMTSHPSVRPYLGRGLRHQDTPMCREMIAEIVADTAARKVVQDLYRMRGTVEDFDSSRFYREHYVRFTKFLPRLQRILVGSPEQAARAEVLEASPLLQTVQAED
jgi:hypothetical protein